MSTPYKPVRFKFRDLKWQMVWQCGFFLMFVFFFVFALRQGNVYWPCLFFLPVFGFLLFVGYSTISVLMDIFFDATGISRCIGRKVVQHIPWEDVRLIRVFDSYSRQEHKKTIGMHIFSRNKAHPSSTSGGKIVICECPMRQGTFSELIAVMNTYITEHQISIESAAGGVTTHPDNLSYVPRRPTYHPIDWYNR
jgi:hypothetical protein